MKTVAEVLQLGLVNSSLEQSSHRIGMCLIVKMLNHSGIITLSEYTRTTLWLDVMVDAWDVHAYLHSWITELHKPTVLSDAELFQLWCQWYEDSINELNRGEMQ